MKLGHNIIFVVIVLLFLSSVSAALTANIGNARMILRAKVGDTIEKTVLVKNINNESVDISIFASGDLAKDIVIKDMNFTLQPGEEKDAEFEIKVKKEGTFDSKINVKFTSVIEKSGVGLSSNVVVIASSGDSNFFENENSTDETNPDINNDNIIETSGKINWMMILFSITGLILLVFFIVLIIYYFNSKKPQETASEIIRQEEIEKEKNTERTKIGEKTKPKKSSKK